MAVLSNFDLTIAVYLSGLRRRVAAFKALTRQRNLKTKSMAILRLGLQSADVQPKSIV